MISWTSAAAIAGASIYGLAVLAAPIAPALPFAGPALTLSALIFGGLLGAVQRRLLKPLWQFPAGWIWATAIGLGLGLPLAVGLLALLRETVVDWPDSYRLTVFLIASGSAGAISCLGQWRYIRKLTFRHSWWLLANGVGWLMAWILVLAFGLFLGEGEPLPVSAGRFGDALILGGLAGLVIGFEQGIALVGLFAQSAWENRG